MGGSSSKPADRDDGTPPVAPPAASPAPAPVAPVAPPPAPAPRAPAPAAPAPAPARAPPPKAAPAAAPPPPPPQGAPPPPAAPVAAAAPSPSPPPSARLVVTGFGPFQGVPVNPSETVVRALKDHVAKAAPHIAARIVATDVLQTSAAAVKQYAAALDAPGGAAAAAAERGAALVVIHIGVDVASSSPGAPAKLEAVAYNDAAFRCPDADGVTLDCAVSEGGAFPRGARLMSKLPARALAAAVAAKGHRLVVSGDAGRFLCNALYWLSLEAGDECGGDGDAAKPPRHALFLHLPPADVMPTAEALALVTAVCEEAVGAV